MASDLLLISVLLVLSAFFSGSEAALFSLSRLQRRRLEREGSGGASIVRLLSIPRRLLVTILIGNMFVNIASSSVCTTLSVKLFGMAGVGISVAVMTFLLLIFGEITPKVFAVRNNERFSLVVAPVLSAFSRLIAGPACLLEKVCDWVLARLDSEEEVSQDEPVITEGELEMLVKMGEEEGTLRRREKELLDYILEFKNISVKEVMTPRVEVKAVDVSLPLDKLAGTVRMYRHSRVPMYEGNIDEVVSILHVRPFLLGGASSLEGCTSSPYFVPENKKLVDLLQDFQQQGVDLALVIDEYGALMGLVTMEDALEEIFGEVYDEDDPREEELVRVADNVWLARGTASFSEVIESTGFVPEGLEEDEVTTIAGFLMNRLSRIPRKGDVVREGEWEFTVTKCSRRRILEVRIRRLVQARSDGEGSVG